jgi:hypothetical protein
MEENSEYKSYKVITLRDDSPANCLWVNGTLLHLPIDHRYGENIRVNIILFIFFKIINFYFRF